MNLPNLQEIDQIRKTGFRPQVVGCILNNKKILFFYKNKYNLWQLPQGGIDNRENIEKAVIREMTEELGISFTKKLEVKSLFGYTQLIFPPKLRGSRSLKTDSGASIFMKGKKYFFIEINTNIGNLDIKETEFNKYKWLDYRQAIELSKNIYQKGKREMTTKILSKLHNLDLL